MEQLLALAFNDSTSNTTVIPTASTGGTGLAIGGSSDPASPSSGYMDYLDITGNILTTVGTTAPVRLVLRSRVVDRGRARRRHQHKIDHGHDQS